MNLAKIKKIGRDYRQDHAQKDENGQVTAIKPIKPRKVADLLEKEVEFAHIVDDKSNNAERSMADLMFRDEDNGIFVRDNAEIAKMINAIERNITESQAKNILYWLECDADYIQRTKEPYLVPVGNGVYNLRTKKLEKYEKYAFTSKVATDYVDSPTVPVIDGWRVDKWIDNDICDGKQDKQTLFWQAMYCIINPNDNKKGCLFLTDNGQGNTGKGTFEGMITELVGMENRADLTLRQFERPFELASIVNKALIIGDDNEPDLYIKSSRSLKSVVAKERILINPKHDKPFSYTATAFVVQSMNGTPKFKDKSGALYDRFRALNFGKRYEDSEVNLDVKNKFVKDKRVLQWILYRALQVKPFSRMIKTKESTDIVLDAKLNSDPVLEFIADHLDEFKSTFIPSKAFFNIFRAVYANENGQRTKLTQRAFTGRARPIMAQRGWEFGHDTHNFNDWHEEDKEHFLHSYDQNYLNHVPGTYQYPFDVTPKTKGGFYKLK